MHSCWRAAHTRKIVHVLRLWIALQNHDYILAICIMLVRIDRGKYSSACFRLLRCSSLAKKRSSFWSNLNFTRNFAKIHQNSVCGLKKCYFHETYLVDLDEILSAIYAFLSKAFWQLQEMITHKMGSILCHRVVLRHQELYPAWHLSWGHIHGLEYWKILWILRSCWPGWLACGFCMRIQARFSRSALVREMELLKNLNCQELPSLPLL